VSYVCPVVSYGTLNSETTMDVIVVTPGEWHIY